MDAEEGDYCLPPEISTDNTSHAEYSIVTIEVLLPLLLTSSSVPMSESGKAWHGQSARSGGEFRERSLVSRAAE